MIQIEILKDFFQSSLLSLSLVPEVFVLDFRIHSLPLLHLLCCLFFSLSNLKFFFSKWPIVSFFLCDFAKIHPLLPFQILSVTIGKLNVGFFCFDHYLAPLFFIQFFYLPLWFLVLDRCFHSLHHSHDLIFTKYCVLYYLSFLNSFSLITTCSLSAYLSLSLLYPVTHSFWDLQSINLSDSYFSQLLPSFSGLTSFDSLVFIFISVCFSVCGFFGCFSQCPVSNTFPRHLFMLFLNFHSCFSEYCWRVSAQQSFGLSSALPVLILLPNGLFNHLGRVFFFLVSLLPGLLFILGFMCLFFFFPKLFCFLTVCFWTRPLPLTCESLSL